MNATAVANLMQETRPAIISSDLRPALPRIWRPLSELLARASYGLQSSTLELLAGSLVRYEDARSALEKLGAVTVKKSPPTFVQAGPMDPWALMQKALLDALVL